MHSGSHGTTLDEGPPGSGSAFKCPISGLKSAQDGVDNPFD